MYGINILSMDINAGVWDSIVKGAKDFGKSFKYGRATKKARDNIKTIKRITENPAMRNGSFDEALKKAQDKIKKQNMIRTANSGFADNTLNKVGQHLGRNANRYAVGAIGATGALGVRAVRNHRNKNNY